MNKSNLQRFNILTLTLGEKVDNMERDLKKYAAKPDSQPKIVAERTEIISLMRKYITTAQETVSSEYTAGFDAGMLQFNNDHFRKHSPREKEIVRNDHETKVRNQFPHLY